MATYNKETVNQIRDMLTAKAEEFKGQDPQAIKGHILQIFNEAGITEAEWHKISASEISMINSTGRLAKSRTLDEQVEVVSRSASKGTMGEQNKENDPDKKSKYFVIFTPSDKNRLKNMDKASAIAEIRKKHEIAAMGAGWKQSDLNEPCSSIELASGGQVNGSSEPYIKVIAEFEYNTQVLGMSPAEAAQQTENAMNGNNPINGMLATGGTEHSADQQQRTFD